MVLADRQALDADANLAKRYRPDRIRILELP
jgi:hypothetical protein